jgi:hypothetical protein
MCAFALEESTKYQVLLQNFASRSLRTNKEGVQDQSCSSSICQHWSVRPPARYASLTYYFGLCPQRVKAELLQIERTESVITWRKEEGKKAAT